jgi:hypothetical protein
MKRLCVLLFFFFPIHMMAAPMMRVVSVRNARTLIVDKRGVAADIVLGQVVIPPAEEEAATAYLRAKIVGAWVMVETDAQGQSYVYRSPDALFVNGELARRAYASQSTATMVYVGEVMPGARRVEAAPRAPAAPKHLPPPPRPHRHPRRF